MNDRIILSFCIPTYNRAHRVYECVKNILEYPGDDIEVVVSNNASTDNTLEVLGRIDDPRLKVYSNVENIGGGRNWPLVVSKSEGRFAALMSDEDIVCLENLPYYIELLKVADRENIGAVIYSFFPINNFCGDYISKNQSEAYMLAIRHGGHITCHILNMRFFYKRDLSYYSWKNIKEPQTEPQLEILLDIAKEQPIMLVEKSLCRVGNREVSDGSRQNVNIDPNTWLGWAPECRKITFLAYKSYISDTFADSDYHDALLFEVLIKITGLAAAFFARVLTSTNPKGDQAFLWEEARRVLGYTRTDAIKVLVEYFTSHAEHLHKKTKNELWKQLIGPFESAMRTNYHVSAPVDLSHWQRVKLGDFLFYISLTFNQSFAAGKAIPDMELADDIDDLLGLKKTDKMYALLKKGDYDSVINFTDISTYRANYLRGQAYLFKGELEKAGVCFETFLDTVLNPKCLGDIITGALSVQYSYYYLGVICQRTGDINKAVEYFAKCNELTDELLIGENLMPKRLGLVF